MLRSVNIPIIANTDGSYEQLYLDKAMYNKQTKHAASSISYEKVTPIRNTSASSKTEQLLSKQPTADKVIKEDAPATNTTPSPVKLNGSLKYHVQSGTTQPNFDYTVSAKEPTAPITER